MRCYKIDFPKCLEPHECGVPSRVKFFFFVCAVFLWKMAINIMSRIFHFFVVNRSQWLRNFFFPNQKFTSLLYANLMHILFILIPMGKITIKNTFSEIFLFIIIIIGPIRIRRTEYKVVNPKTIKTRILYPGHNLMGRKLARIWFINNFLKVT